MDDSETEIMGCAGSSPEALSRKLEIPDYTLLRIIGRGAFGEVWLARDVMDNHRAIKVIRRENFDSDHLYEREFEGIRAFEPVSRKDNAFLRILHAARRDGRAIIIT